MSSRESSSRSRKQAVLKVPPYVWNIKQVITNLLSSRPLPQCCPSHYYYLLATFGFIPISFPLLSPQSFPIPSLTDSHSHSHYCPTARLLGTPKPEKYVSRTPSSHPSVPRHSLFSPSSSPTLSSHADVDPHQHLPKYAYHILQAREMGGESLLNPRRPFLLTHFPFWFSRSDAVCS